MHHNAHRFSIEWARVEPEPGQFDQDALAHYVDVVRTCRRNGMEPVVTLQHFTLPRLADRLRRLRRPASAGALCALRGSVRRGARRHGHVVGDGERTDGGRRSRAPRRTWPPGERSLRRTLAALRGLLRMHAAGAQAITTVSARHGRPAQVSIAHHERRFVPRDPSSRVDRAVAQLPDFLFNRWFLRSCVAGRVLASRGPRRGGARARRIAHLPGAESLHQRGRVARPARTRNALRPP